MPLLSFDIFLEAYHRELAEIKDLQTLRQLTKKCQWRDLPQKRIEKVIREQVILLTDIQQTIVFSSHNIIALTGYHPEEVIGKTPRMFQGSATASSIRSEIRDAMKNSLPFHVTTMNYKKDGSIYRCEIDAIPLFNRKHIHTHYIAFEKIAS